MTWKTLGPYSQALVDALAEGEKTADELAKIVYGEVDVYTRVNALQLIANLKRDHEYGFERVIRWRMTRRGKR